MTTTVSNVVGSCQDTTVPVPIPFSANAAAVVHAHSPEVIALSATRTELPAIHYQVAMFGGPVAVAAYATYGSQELARHVVAALRVAARGDVAGPVVALLADSWDRYYSKPWVQQLAGQ